MGADDEFRHDDDDMNASLEAIHHHLVEQFPMYQTDPGFEHWLHQRAGGDPVLLREYLHMLDGYGVIGGTGIVSHQYRKLPEPAKVPAYIRQQFERLPEPTKRLLECASVEGEHFSSEGVAALAGVPIEQVDEHLAAALTMELIARNGGERLYAGTSRRYRFVPLQVRDILYRAMPESRRLELHRRFVDFLREAIGRVEDAGNREMLSKMLEEHNRKVARPDGSDAAPQR